MTSNLCKTIILVCIWLSLPGTVQTSFAYTPIGPVVCSSQDEVRCFFSVFRKDGSIVVTMQKDAYGKIYQNAANASVTKDGKPVGFRYLRQGMPITLIIQNNSLIEIQVQTTGGE
jgi:hypothetical protein